MKQDALFDPVEADIDEILQHLDDLDQDDPRAWPQTLADMVDIITDHLQRRHNESGDEAFRHAQELVVLLANFFGGRQVYLPRDEKLRLAMRDKEIWLRFNGRNMADMEQTYKLTKQQIYYIIAQQRALHKKRTQPQLPGFSDD